MTFLIRTATLAHLCEWNRVSLGSDMAPHRTRRNLPLVMGYRKPRSGQYACRRSLNKLGRVGAGDVFVWLKMLHRGFRVWYPVLTLSPCR